MSTAQSEGSLHFTEQDVKKYEDRFRSSGVAAAIEFAKTMAEKWKNVPLNIGIIGNSGTGKSSFINAIRGLKADDVRAAAVGVNETTTTPTPYAHPNNPLLKFWDLPGIGTPTFPQKTYLQKIGFKKYDFFLIISNNRFTENDQEIAGAIAEKKKKFFFVRTHMDTEIENDKKAHPITHNSERLLASIKEKSIKELRKILYLGDLYSKGDGVFLIDNYNRGQYDFNRLEQRISDDFPSLKRDAFVLSVGALSEEMVKKKVEVLRRTIWTAAISSGALAAVPVPFLSSMVDLGVILGLNMVFFEALGLDNKSLERTARIMSCDAAELKTIVGVSFLRYCSAIGLEILFQSMPRFVIGEVVEDVVSIALPIVGSVIAAAVSIYTTRKILNDILSKLEEIALKVVKAATKESSKLVNVQ